MELPLTPLDFLARARRLFPDRVGVVDGRPALHLPGVRRPLRPAGLGAPRPASACGRGDRVAWLCGNTHELLEAYYGVLLAGAVLVPLNIRLARPELRLMLDDCGASVLFRHPDQPDPGGPTAPGRPRRRATRRCWRPSPPTAAAGARGRRAVAWPSSSTRRGTTGEPKGAMLTHRGLYLHAVHSALTNGLSGDDVVLHTIPLFHVNGWGTPHYVTGLGGVHVMLPRFDAGEVLRLVEARAGDPALPRADHGHRAARSTPTCDRRDLDVARADLDRRRADAADAAGRGGGRASAARRICGYGMTESSPDAHPLARQARRAAVGRPAGHHRAAHPRRRRAGARRRRRRGALGRRAPPARCACARTT